MTTKIINKNIRRTRRLSAKTRRLDCLIAATALSHTPISISVPDKPLNIFVKTAYEDDKFGSIAYSTGVKQVIGTIKMEYGDIPIIEGENGFLYIFDPSMEGEEFEYMKPRIVR